MNTKNKIILIIIVLLLMALSFLFIYLYNETISDDKDNDNGGKVTEPTVEQKPIVSEEENEGDLNDYNRFFAIEDIIAEFILDYNSNNDTKISNILADNYLNEKGLENIKNSLSYLNDYLKFKIKKVYYKDLNKRVVKYYVDGIVSGYKMDENNFSREVSYTLYFDQDNMTYKLVPEKEYNYVLNNIIDNGYNRYKIKDVSDEKIAMLYYDDFRLKVLNNDEQLENIITNNNILKPEDIDDSIIKSYKIEKNTDKMIIYVRNNDNIVFTFYVEGILNYTVKVS